MSKDAASLETVLKGLRTEQEVEQYLQSCIRTKGRFHYFYQYLNQYISDHAVPVSEVIASSRINRNYVYNITNGVKKNPGRDKIIALCMGAQMGYDDTNRGLEIGGYCRLDPEDERDVWIAVAIINRQYEVLKLNILLEERGMDPLEI